MAQIPLPSGNSTFLTNPVFFSKDPPLAPAASEYSNLNLTSILRDIATDLAALRAAIVALGGSPPALLTTKE
jgi:hypothetical protein